jgi:hypothetical protein
MPELHKQRGFVLIGLLIVIVIVMILYMGGLNVSTGLLGEGTQYDPDKVMGGVNIATLRGTLSSLAMFQADEQARTGKYFPTIEKLIARTYSVGYGANATDRVPLVPMFDLKMQFVSGGFIIKAVPNKLKGAPSDSPTYVIDQTMQIREE